MTSSSFTVPAIPNLSIPFLANIPVLFMIFISFFVVYVIVSIILMYHWSHYGTHRGVMVFVETLFVSVSVGLFIFTFLALSYY